MTIQSPDLASRALSFFQGVLGRARGARSTDIPRVDDAAFRRYANYFTSQVERLNAGLVDGRITIEEWQLAMRTEIEQLNTTAYVIGRGGVGEMDSEDINQLNTIVDRQLAFVDNWANELKSGGMPSQAAMNSRAGLYLGSANAAIERGSTERLGVPALPFYPAEDTQCHGNCRCRWNIVAVPGGFDCTWERAADDSCPTCLAREAVANPLQIRNGIVQPFNEAGTIYVKGA